jgi:hypothetical protein
VSKARCSFERARSGSSHHRIQGYPRSSVPRTRVGSEGIDGLAKGFVGGLAGVPFVLVVVLVLENCGTLMRCAIAGGLEGSRFGTRPSALANFASTLIPPKRATKQAAPGNCRTRGFVPKCRPGILDLPQRTDKPITRRNVPGSRLFYEICGHPPAKTNVAMFQSRCKVAPLQGAG